MSRMQTTYDLKNRTLERIKKSKLKLKNSRKERDNMLEQTRKQVKVIKPTAQNNGQRDLRVAAYCRVSTDSEDQSNSFLAQVN